MTIAEPAFTLGVEEEYLLVDMETGDLASDPPESLIDECVRELGEQVTNEFLRLCCKPDEGARWSGRITCSP